MKLLVLLPFLPAIISALDVQGTFAPSPLLPDPSTLPPSTSLTLTTAGIAKRTLIRRDNTFSFSDVPEGSYLLDVQCQTYQFAPLRVDVNGQGEVVVHQTFRGNEWRNKGEEKSYPIVRRPLVISLLPYLQFGPWLTWGCCFLLRNIGNPTSSPY